MLNSDEHALALTDLFYGAALGTNSWLDALAAFAAATGSRTGELITIGANATVPVNFMTNTDPALHDDFAAKRGGDPTVNPRVNAGMCAPVLKVMAECDFMTPEEHKLHPHYQEFARPWDIPYICLATLDRSDGLLVGLAVLRSEREGHISTAEREVFARLAPHVRAAVRMQMALERDGIKLLTGMLESLSIPAFLCDRSGRVQSMTPAAEAIISRAEVLQVKAGYLQVENDADHRTLMSAIETVARAPGLAESLPRSVIVRSTRNDVMPMILDVVRLPGRTLELSLDGYVIVVPQGSGNGDSRRRLLLQAIYKLTAAETDVAMQLAQGQSAESIAANRSVAIGTVRAQIKSILAKFGMTRQVELVARLGQL
jgi:DNA-binding CsgD family transcriptional regulator